MLFYQNILLITYSREAYESKFYTWTLEVRLLTIFLLVNKLENLYDES